MDKNYDDVRLNLIKMLEELDERLNVITQEVRHENNEVEKDWEEQAIQNEDNDVQDFLGNSAYDEIAAIKKALVRIEEGNYEICQMCGDAIHSDRLKAIPYSAYCFNCANSAGK